MKHTPLPVDRTYEWSGEDARTIRAGLASHRDQIARVLEIDPEELQGVRLPKDAGNIPMDASAFERAMAARTGGRPALIPTIDVVIDEIEAVCVRTCTDIVNVQNKLSYAKRYRALEQLTIRKKIAEAEIESLDPRVREMLAERYPGGRHLFAPGSVTTDGVRAAAGAVLSELKPPSPGRPAGTQTRLVPFIEALADIYDNRAAKPARRRYREVGEGDKTLGLEYGPFKEFADVVFGALPAWARQRLLRPRSQLDAAIRKALGYRDRRSKNPNR